MRGMRVAAIGCFVVALAGVGYLGWDHFDHTVRPEVAVCRTYLHDKADKPSTLSWPGGESVSVNGSFATVYGTVKGDDKYGSNLTSRFECALQELADGGWRVIDVK